MIASTEPKFVDSLAALAAVLGRNERTIQRYVAAGMGQSVLTKGGKFSVAKVRQWIAINVKAEHDPTKVERVVADCDLRVALQRAELAKTQEQARKEKLKNDLLEGRLVDRSEVELRAGEFGARVRQRLESFPGEVETQLPLEFRQEIKQELERAVEHILKEMSTWEFLS